MIPKLLLTPPLLGRMHCPPFCRSALERWTAAFPDDAAAWLTSTRGNRKKTPPFITSIAIEPSNKEADQKQGHILIAVGAGVVGEALAWCSSSSKRRALLIIVDAEAMDDLVSSKGFVQILAEDRLSLRFWPRQNLSERWSWPENALSALLLNQVEWRVEQGAESVLDAIQAVAQRALGVLAECSTAPNSPLVNHWHNLPLLTKAYDYSSLEGRGRGLSVVIAGGGPSFCEAVPFLHKYRDRVLLFAGGSALEACAEFDLEPDLACLIDPSSTQWLRGRSFCKSKIPLLTTLRCHAATLAAWQGPLLFAPQKDELGFISVIEHLLGLKNPHLDSGILDGVGLLTSFALFLGVPRIHFVGRELSWTERPYAAAVDLQSEPPVRVITAQGNVWSTAHWLAVAEATRELVVRHPKVNWSCSSKQGLLIPGVGDQDLETWLKAASNSALREVNDFFSNLPKEGVELEDVYALQRDLRDGLLGGKGAAGHLVAQRLVLSIQGLLMRILDTDRTVIQNWQHNFCARLLESWEQDPTRRVSP